jgi:hypothetical protein
MLKSNVLVKQLKALFIISLLNQKLIRTTYSYQSQTLNATYVSTSNSYFMQIAMCIQIMHTWDDNIKGSRNLSAS